MNNVMSCANPANGPHDAVFVTAEFLGYVFDHHTLGDQRPRTLNLFRRHATAVVCLRFRWVWIGNQGADAVHLRYHPTHELTAMPIPAQNTTVGMIQKSEEIRSSSLSLDGTTPLATCSRAGKSAVVYEVL